jgi:hypothetical protein
VEALYVEPVPARTVAKNLQSTGDYQHISVGSLMKYVLSGPVRIRSRQINRPELFPGPAAGK